MEPIDALFEDLKQRTPQYGSYVLKVATTPSRNGGVGVRGKLTFAREEMTEETVREYGHLSLHELAGPVSEATEMIQSLAQGSAKDLPFDLVLEENDSARVQGPETYGGSSLPEPIGYGGRGDWPSRRYRIDEFPRPDLPSGPLVVPGLPIIITTKSEVDSWLGIGDDRLSQGGFVIEIPDFRARIARCRVAEEEIIVWPDGDLPAGQLEARATVKGDWEESIELAVTRTDDGFSTKVVDPLHSIRFFLIESESQEVLDWVYLSSYGEKAPQIEFARSEPRVRSLIEGGESTTVEFKEDRDNGHTLVQSVVAFANSEGGTILLGVDDNGAVTGTDADEDQVRIEEWLHSRCDPPVPVDFDSVEIEEKELLVIDVPEGSNKPYQHIDNGIIYVRRGATDRPANRSEILNLVDKTETTSSRPYGAAWL